MVFNPPTSTDENDATLAAAERGKISTFNHFLKIMPQLFSWVIVEIRSNKNLPSATYEQFNNNLYVRLIGTREFCDQGNCNSYYSRGETCKETTEPLVFKSGNSDITACHASCYNLFDGAKDAEGNLRKAPLTAYSEKQQCCLIRHDRWFRLGFDDYMRTDVHPTPRIDTIGTGFDLSEKLYTDSEGNETYQFLLNRYYCDDFRYEFKGSECKPSLTETIIGTLGSTNLYKGAQYGIRKIQTGVGLSGVQKLDLPPIEKKPSLSLIEWKSNVNKSAHFFNPNLLLSDLGITRETSHLIFTTEYGWPGKLVEPLLVYQQPKGRYTQIDYSSKRNLLPQFRVDEYGRREFDEYEILEVAKVLIEMNEHVRNNLPKHTEVDVSKIRAIILGLKDMIYDEDFYTILASSFFSTYVATLKRLAAIANEQFEKVTISAALRAQKVMFSQIASGSVMLMRRFGPMGFKLLTSTLKSLTVAGAILDILGFVDLFLLGTDLYNLRNLQGQAFVDMLSENDLNEKEQVYGYKSFEFSPIYFVSIYDAFTNRDVSSFDIELTPADNTSLLLHAQNIPYSIPLEKVTHKNNIIQTFLWESEYTYRLENNSDGLPINWGEESGVELTAFNEMVDNKFADYPNTFFEYKDYSTDIRKRVNLATTFCGATVIMIMIRLFFSNNNLIIFIITVLILLLSLTSFALTIAPANGTG